MSLKSVQSPYFTDATKVEINGHLNKILLTHDPLTVACFMDPYMLITSDDSMAKGPIPRSPMKPLHYRRFIAYLRAICMRLFGHSFGLGSITPWFPHDQWVAWFLWMNLCNLGPCRGLYYEPLKTLMICFYLIIIICCINTCFTPNCLLRFPKQKV